MSHEPGNIKDEPRFDALRLQGMDRKEAVQVANSPKAPGTNEPDYERLSTDALRRRAEQLAIRDYDTLSREELLRLLRIM